MSKVTLQDQIEDVLNRVYNIAEAIKKLEDSQYEEEIRDNLENVQDYLGQVETILVRID